MEPHHAANRNCKIKAYPESAQAFERALALGSDDAEIWPNLALALGG